MIRLVNNFELLNCPNCPTRHYSRGDKRPNSLGKFKVYITNTNWLIFKCVRCRERFKYKFIGSRLTKADMTFDEVNDV